jgi:hypothetical protein
MTAIAYELGHLYDTHVMEMKVANYTGFCATIQYLYTLNACPVPFISATTFTKCHLGWMVRHHREFRRQCPGCGTDEDGHMRKCIALGGDGTAITLKQAVCEHCGHITDVHDDDVEHSIFRSNKTRSPMVNIFADAADYDTDCARLRALELAGDTVKWVTAKPGGPGKPEVPGKHPVDVGQRDRKLLQRCGDAGLLVEWLINAVGQDAAAVDQATLRAAKYFVKQYLGKVVCAVRLLPACMLSAVHAFLQDPSEANCSALH